jgi:hypothetical protein
VPGLNALATKAFDSNHTYSDVVYFVHIYVVEPHPVDPDPSPYTGQVWEMSFSTRAQPRTYSGRVALAAEVEALLEGNQVVLVDELAPGARNNPLWCSYGPAPNSAYLIDQRGKLRIVQKWVNVPKMEAGINLLLGK